MSDKQFISNLSATYADVRKLDVKKINLKGKNILEYIGSSTPTVKHAQDTRETVTENDLWGQWVETKSDGIIIVHDDWVANPNASSSSAWNTSITKVEDNKAYVGDAFFANIQTEKIKDGYNMFASSSLTSFYGDLSNLIDGENMFQFCDNLTSFTSDLSSLTEAQSMFYNCTNLTSFSSDLSSLMFGVIMFYNCTNLTSFTSDLPSLTNGMTMFTYCSNLTSFTTNLPSLTNGQSMFNSCSQLTSFTSDLPSLTVGNSMFASCSNLVSFNADLSNLIDGENMFKGCSLNAESVMYIADSIKDIAAEKLLYTSGTIPYVTTLNGAYSAYKGFTSDGTYIYNYKTPSLVVTSISASNVGKLTLGINVSNNSSTIQQQLEDFAKTATFDSWTDLKKHFTDKGWTVTFQYGGTNTSITYDLRNREQIIPCQIFAKLVQVEDKDSAEYTNEEGTKFYNIHWYHDSNTNNEGYDYFESLEEAINAYSVISKA